MTRRPEYVPAFMVNNNFNNGMEAHQPNCPLRRLLAPPGLVELGHSTVPLYMIHGHRALPPHQPPQRMQNNNGLLMVQEPAPVRRAVEADFDDFRPTPGHQVNFALCKERFSGNGDVRPFINAVIDFKNFSEMNDDSALRSLPLLLTDKAAYWWQDNKTKFTDWDNATKLLRDAFRGRTEQHKIYRRLFSTPQNEEPTEAFVLNSKNLLNKIPANTLTKETQLDMVYALLSRRIKEKIEREDFNSFTDLVEHARRVEIAIAESGPRAPVRPEPLWPCLVRAPPQAPAVPQAPVEPQSPGENQAPASPQVSASAQVLAPSQAAAVPQAPVEIQVPGENQAPASPQVSASAQVLTPPQVLAPPQAAAVPQAPVEIQVPGENQAPVSPQVSASAQVLTPPQVLAPPQAAAVPQAPVEIQVPGENHAPVSPQVSASEQVLTPPQAPAVPQAPVEPQSPGENQAPAVPQAPVEPQSPGENQAPGSPQVSASAQVLAPPQATAVPQAPVEIQVPGENQAPASPQISASTQVLAPPQAAAVSQAPVEFQEPAPPQVMAPPEIPAPPLAAVALQAPKESEEKTVSETPCEYCKMYGQLFERTCRKLHRGEKSGQNIQLLEELRQLDAEKHTKMVCFRCQSDNIVGLKCRNCIRDVSTSCPMINVNIYDTDFNIVLDTGSSHSIASVDLIRHLVANGQHFTFKLLVLPIMGVPTRQVFRVATVDVVAAGVRIPTIFIELPGTVTTVFGMDFMQRSGLVIDFSGIGSWNVRGATGPDQALICEQMNRLQ